MAQHEIAHIAATVSANEETWPRHLGNTVVDDVDAACRIADSGCDAADDCTPQMVASYADVEIAFARMNCHHIALMHCGVADKNSGANSHNLLRWADCSIHMNPVG